MSWFHPYRYKDVFAFSTLYEWLNVVSMSDWSFIDRVSVSRKINHKFQLSNSQFHPYRYKDVNEFSNSNFLICDFEMQVWSIITRIILISIRTITSCEFQSQSISSSFTLWILTTVNLKSMSIIIWCFDDCSHLDCDWSITSFNFRFYNLRFILIGIRTCMSFQTRSERLHVVANQSDQSIDFQFQVLQSQVSTLNFTVSSL